MNSSNHSKTYLQKLEAEIFELKRKLNSAEKEIEQLKTKKDISFEQELKTSKAQYQKLFESQPSAVAIHELIYDDQGDPVDFRYIDGNKNLSTLFNLPLNEIIGKTINELLPGFTHQKKEIFDRFVRISEEGIAESYEDYFDHLGRFCHVQAFSYKKGTFTTLATDITSQKNTEKDFKDSRERLSLAQEIANIGDWYMDLATKEVTWSEQLYRTYGYEINRPIPNYIEFRDLYTPESWELLRDSVDECIKTGKSYELELEIIKEDQSKGWIWAKGVAVYDDSNKMIGLRGVAQDISDKKKTQLELGRYQKGLKESQKIAKVGNWYLDLATDEVSWSEQLFLIHGQNQEDGVPNFSNFAHFYTPESWELLSRKVQACIEHGEPYELELEIVWKDHSKHWMWAKGEAVYNEKGEMIGLQGIAQNIDDRKKLENDIIKAKDQAEFGKQMYMQIAENFPSAYITTMNRDFAVEITTGSEYKNQGQNPKDFYGITVWDAFGDQADFVISHYQRAFEGEKDVQFELKYADGIYYKYTTNPIYNENGEIKTILIVTENITIQKEREKELEDAKLKAEENDRLKSAFLSNMSHEIRTPVNGIVGFAELLGKNNLSEERRKKFTDIIRSSSKQLVNLIDDIIDVSKIEAGQLSIHKQNIDLIAVLNELYFTYKLSKIRKPKQKIDFRLHTPKNYQSLFYMTDPLRLKQVLINLLDNAFKFTATGTIEFGFKMEENHLHFFVKDDGVGIPKDQLSMIFERFQQARNIEAGEIKGTGLGLSICSGLVKLLGGKMDIKSEENKGAEFSFSLPNDSIQPEIQTGHTDKSSNQSFSFKHVKVLVADDEFVNRALFEELFSELECEVHYAENGKEALDLYTNHQNYDVILMDIKMPVMNGIEATKEILKINPKAKVIAQTAHVMHDEIKLFEDSGFVDYLPKPISTKSLIEKLKMHCK